jgi:hypothetical protein
MLSSKKIEIGMVVPRVCAGDVLSLGHRKCLSFEFPDHHSTPAQQRAACHSRQQFVGLLPSCDSHATMLSDPFSSSNGMLAKPLVKPERLLERSAVSTISGVIWGHAIGESRLEEWEPSEAGNATPGSHASGNPLSFCPLFTVASPSLLSSS